MWGKGKSRERRVRSAKERGFVITMSTCRPTYR